MRALVVEEFGRPGRVEQVPDPVCPPDGVIVEVRATGLCRSDWHAWSGHDPDVTLPHVPGHEFAGVVVEVGADVRAVRAGMRVTTPFVCACGRCEQCRAGDRQVCENQYQPGFTGWGSFAERVAVPRADVNIVELPAALDFVPAAGLGCRFATAYRAVTAHARVGAGDWIAVFGCGGVGLPAVMIAVARGARVIGVDPSAAARSLATDFGASHVTGASGAQVIAELRDLTGGGAHAAIDAFGSARTSRAAVECLRRRGRMVQVGLMVGADMDAAMPMGRVLADELEIHGSHGMAARDYPPMLADLAAGTLDPARVVTGRITLDDLAGSDGALAAMSSGSPGGSLVVVP